MTNWKLREFLMSRGVKSASQARQMIQAATTHKISTQAMCDLVNGDLRMLRITTAAAICDTFYCKLSDFFEVIPHNANTWERRAPPLKRRKNRRSKNVDSESATLNLSEFFPNARTFGS